MEMNERQLNELKETLAEMKRLKGNLERELTLYSELVQKVHKTFQNHPELEFSLRDEKRQNTFILNQIVNSNLIQKISRRIPDLEQEIHDRKQREASTDLQAKKVTEKATSVLRYLSKLERELDRQGRG